MAAGVDYYYTNWDCPPRCLAHRQTAEGLDPYWSMGTMQYVFHRVETLSRLRLRKRNLTELTCTVPQQSKVDAVWICGFPGFHLHQLSVGCRLLMSGTGGGEWESVDSGEVKGQRGQIGGSWCPWCPGGCRELWYVPVKERFQFISLVLVSRLWTPSARSARSSGGSFFYTHVSCSYICSE